MRRLFNWTRARSPELSDAQRFLLSLFLRPRDTVTITGGGWGEQWAAALGEPPAKTIDRLTMRGHLQPAATAEALTVVHGVDSLKQALRSRGLKVSGRKAEMIARLLEADPRQCEVDIRGHRILVCSALGAEVGERYARQRAEEREAAVQAAIDRVRRRGLADAAQAIRRFNDGAVLSTGVGLSPAGTEAVHRETLHQLFAGGLPKIIGPLAGEASEHLLVAGAMALLGIANAHRMYLPTGFVSGSRLSDEVAVRMLTFAAMHRRKMAQLRDMDVTHVQIRGVRDGSGCDACSALHGHYALHAVPELPYAKCTCERGCRCLVLAEL